MIPNNWVYSNIGSHVDLLSGHAFKSEKYTSSNAGIKLLRGDNIAQGYIRWRDAKRWSKNDIKGLEKFYLEERDLVIAMDRTWIPSGLKISEIRNKDLPCLLVQRVSRLRTNKTLHQKLLKHIFSTNRFVQYVKSVQTETAVPHISARQIKEYPILIPPIVEQTKIADILSTWDKAIDVTEKLIENSKAQKKALMQQLLIDHKTSINFKEYKLGSLGSTYTGLSGKTKDDFGKGKPFIPYLNIFANSRVNIEAISLVSINQDEKQYKVIYGDIFFTTSSETPDEVGMSSVLLDKTEELYLNSFCFGFRLNDFEILLPEYAQYLFRGQNIRRQIFKLAQGATRYNLSKKSLLKITLKLPTIKEQQKIAFILSAADKEIELLQQKYDFLIQEKKALMQQLLTGKRRVKVDKH